MAKDPMDKISAEFSRWAAAPDRELSGEAAAGAAEVDLLLGLLREDKALTTRFLFLRSNAPVESIRNAD